MSSHAGVSATQAETLLLPRSGHHAGRLCMASGHRTIAGDAALRTDPRLAGASSVDDVGLSGVGSVRTVRKSGDARCGSEAEVTSAGLLRRWSLEVQCRRERAGEGGG